MTDTIPIWLRRKLIDSIQAFVAERLGVEYDYGVVKAVSHESSYPLTSYRLYSYLTEGNTEGHYIFHSDLPDTKIPLSELIQYTQQDGVILQYITEYLLGVH